jgi:hypothetical protein
LFLKWLSARCSLLRFKYSNNLITFVDIILKLDCWLNCTDVTLVAFWRAFTRPVASSTDLGPYSLMCSTLYVNPTVYEIGWQLRVHRSEEYSKTKIVYLSFIHSCEALSCTFKIMFQHRSNALLALVRWIRRTVTSKTRSETSTSQKALLNAKKNVYKS